MAAFMPNCREVAAILSGDGVAAEPWGRRVLLALHLWHCEVCARFARQLDRIREALTAAWAVPADGELEAFKRRVVGRLGAP